MNTALEQQLSLAGFIIVVRICYIRVFLGHGLTARKGMYNLTATEIPPIWAGWNSS